MTYYRAKLVSLKNGLYENIATTKEKAMEPLISKVEDGERIELEEVSKQEYAHQELRKRANMMLLYTCDKEFRQTANSIMYLKSLGYNVTKNS